MYYVTVHTKEDEVDEHLSTVAKNGSLKRMWEKFETARSAVKRDEPRQMWASTQVLPNRSGQDREKRVQLLSWIVDPKFTDAYLAMTKNLKSRKEFKVKQQWMTTKEVRALVCGGGLLSVCTLVCMHA